MPIFRSVVVKTHYSRVGPPYETQPRCGRDAAETRPKRVRDATETWPRCSRDVLEMQEIVAEIAAEIAAEVEAQDGSLREVHWEPFDGWTWTWIEGAAEGFQNWAAEGGSGSCIICCGGQVGSSAFGSRSESELKSPCLTRCGDGSRTGRMAEPLDCESAVCRRTACFARGGGCG